MRFEPCLAKAPAEQQFANTITETTQKHALSLLKSQRVCILPRQTTSDTFHRATREIEPLKRKFDKSISSWCILV